MPTIHKNKETDNKFYAESSISYVHDFFIIRNWLISNSTEILPKIKLLKNAQYWKFDFPKQLLLSNNIADFF